MPRKRTSTRCRLDEPQHAPAGGRLPASRLADDRQRFAGVHVEAHAADRVHVDEAAVLADLELLHQPGDRQDRLDLPHDAATPAIDGAGSTASRRYATSDGSTSAHDSIAYRQRGWNGQPDGSDCGVAAMPGIDTCTSSRASSRGRHSSSPRVYGCTGLAEHRADGAGLDDAAGVHHVDPVGRPGDHAEIVGDQHERQIVLVAAGCRAAP